MNNITTFIINNFGTIVALIVAIAGLVKAIVQRKKQQIYANLFTAVTQAQSLEINNADKFNYVFDAIYKKLNLFYKLQISEDDIKRAIEFTLNKLKEFSKQQQSTLTAGQNIIVKNEATIPKSLYEKSTIDNSTV